MPARRHRLHAAVAGSALASSIAALHGELGLPGEFDDDALAEADGAARTVAAVPGDGLADLRHIPFLTIDPEGSQDLDQALHLRRTPDGAVLHYAIADVPAFVRPGGAVDAAARLRGQTLYAVDGRIPLHPLALSEGATSLLPGRDRRAFVWRFDLDDDARPRHTTVRRGIVRSRAQWTYAEAQHALHEGTAPASLTALRWFGLARREREQERGGATLNTPEIEVQPTATGYRLERRVVHAIEDWNARVSLLTGMEAARIMIAGGIGILRTMPAADAQDVAVFRARTVALGVPWTTDIDYGEYLRRLPSGHATTPVILDAAATLFRGAGYTAFDGTVPADTVQSAIAAPYAHTTAPLRRLVDRWSLVVCESLCAGRPVPDWARESLHELPHIMGRSNQLASRLEAATVARVEAALLAGRDGEVFTGEVLGRHGDGMHVQLTDPQLLVKVPHLNVAPGARVRLRLQRADIASGDIVLAPETSGTSAAADAADGRR